MLSVMLWLRDYRKSWSVILLREGVKMGALVNAEQRADVQEKVNILLAAGCDRLGGQADLSAAGAFFRQPCVLSGRMKHRRYMQQKPFGPVATLMPAQNQRHALQLACAGGGSLAGEHW